MLGEKIANGWTITERHIIADVIATFEQEPLLRPRRFVINPPRLLHGDKVFSAVDNQ